MFTMQKNSPDEDRWLRVANFRLKGKMYIPQTQVMMMHKTENKYEVGKVRDWEEAKQRQFRAILNKLTPQNFEKLLEQVKAVNIDNAKTLRGATGQIFDRALMEPTFCEMYANFCYHLCGELPDFGDDNEKITFKRLLLNKCQEAFDRGEREWEEANKAYEERELIQYKEEREEERIKARRRMLGNIRLIGELFKEKMLPERIIQHCIQELLDRKQTPDEEDVEALCKLMSTIGETFEDRSPKSKKIMDAYFEKMEILSNDKELSSRVRFMVKDTIDLRENKWQPRRKVEVPKKIEEVHRDVAQEQQAQAIRIIPDRFSGQAAYYQSSAPEQSVNYGGRNLRNPDHTLDESSSTQNTPTEMSFEESMRKMSRTANKFVRDLKMACQDSNSLSSRRIQFFNKKCKCGKNAWLRISESKNNPNRLYYCCANGEDDCGFFEWWLPQDSALPLDMMTEGLYRREPLLGHNRYPKLVQRIIAWEANVPVWRTIILLNFFLSMFIIYAK